ncbi:bifunctional 2-polyprenyl-6-hydroxyphenol methylase/3-demethylubiquinol 3-O-methyltransferase UbiG [Brevundimonas sp. Leaf168]|uniref:class I SAM-dependent methyltransferase n=1 Tax=Brevundimonas sp. Leaf168 TaxID=1736283 RepID=UPI0006F8F6E5|nr:methyltransferase domain-containing protein [Brevundimonas sp. Leaf168]KQR56243.1 hypothetical protein ASF81_07215 [Brevundimonas sp. Leaf168]
MTPSEIQARLDAFTASQNWMHNIPLPHGLFTVKPAANHLAPLDDKESRARKVAVLQSRGAKEGLLCALDLGGKDILDVACGEGKYSFIAAGEAKSVFGLDIDEERIAKARFVNELVNLDNLSFDVVDIYSSQFQQLPKADLALCFGLIHRLPDPFNFINAVSSCADALLFEWIGAPPLLDQNVPWAFHNQGRLYEWQNAIGNFEEKGVASKGRAGGGVNRASYWNISYGALEAMCQRSGLNHFLRFSRAPMYPDLSAQPELQTKRVMLLASRNPAEVMGRRTREGLIRWKPKRPV